jgi:hypothetical protein
MSMMLRRLGLVLVPAVVALVVAPQAAMGAQLDTVTVAGSGQAQAVPGAGLSNINIAAQSGSAGQNPSGSVSFTVFPIGFNIAGSVTCMSVTGPDLGGGAPGAPTVAVLNFFSPSGLFPGVNTAELVDNGGNGADIISVVPTGRAPGDCSLLSVSLFDEGKTVLTNGRAVVFDARLVPTSKDQCKDGGWRDFPQFKNQGDCVSFVETGK